MPKRVSFSFDERSLEALDRLEAQRGRTVCVPTFGRGRDVRIPFATARQLQERARVMAANSARKAAEREGFDLAGCVERQTAAAFVKLLFRTMKHTVATVEAAAARAASPEARAALEALAAQLAEGEHFNGATLLGAGEGE